MDERRYKITVQKTTLIDLFDDLEAQQVADILADRERHYHSLVDAPTIVTAEFEAV